MIKVVKLPEPHTAAMIIASGKELKVLQMFGRWAGDYAYYKSVGVDFAAVQMALLEIGPIPELRANDKGNDMSWRDVP